DRKGVDETRRDLQQMLELSDISADAWRPPILPVVATTGEGIPEFWSAVVAHRAAIEASGELVRRRRRRLAEELREIVARRLELRARQLATGELWDRLKADVADHRIDPWSAADEMLDGIGG
ncbi:MAG TPA: methylmalonyl Co-A mutase-associated GTPase MeaB, partial [Ilumatobacteraceae bacterium]|nr:methylmalonyl Co-A mutase-associated GTPase MeaB [Ilumatobacteraceae bacterium]